MTNKTQMYQKRQTKQSCREQFPKRTSRERGTCVPSSIMKPFMRGAVLGRHGIQLRRAVFGPFSHRIKPRLLSLQTPTAVASKTGYHELPTQPHSLLCMKMTVSHTRKHYISAQQGSVWAITLTLPSPNLTCLISPN